MPERRCNGSPLLRGAISSACLLTYRYVYTYKRMSGRLSKSTMKDATRVSDLGLKGPGFDARAMPKSEYMFVNIYHY